jgi:hypothetical protein
MLSHNLDRHMEKVAIFLCYRYRVRIWDPMDKQDIQDMVEHLDVELAFLVLGSSHECIIGTIFELLDDEAFDQQSEIQEFFSDLSEKHVHHLHWRVPIWNGDRYTYVDDTREEIKMLRVMEKSSDEYLERKVIQSIICYRLTRLVVGYRYTITSYEYPRDDTPFDSNPRKEVQGRLLSASRRLLQVIIHRYIGKKHPGILMAQGWADHTQCYLAEWIGQVGKLEEFNGLRDLLHRLLTFENCGFWGMDRRKIPIRTLRSMLFDGYTLGMQLNERRWSCFDTAVLWVDKMCKKLEERELAYIGGLQGQQAENLVPFFTERDINWVGRVVDDMEKCIPVVPCPGKGR